MRDLRRRKLDANVWIPLRASEEEASGRFGHLGYRHDVFALCSLAVPVEQKEKTETLDWPQYSLATSHQGYVDEDHYVPGDVHDVGGLGLGGVALALSQDGNCEDPSQWHLHQDLVITLGLKREGENWVAINEGYIEVARLRRAADGSPTRLEFRAEHLKDYLCARGMALYVLWYRDRWEVVDDPSHITWSENPLREISPEERWEGRVTETDETGSPFGSSAAYIHMGRENVDTEEDVPRIGPSDSNLVTKTWTVTRDSRKLFTVRGEVWRKEWVNPGEHSPRVRRDKHPGSVFYIIDAAGKKESRETLRESGQWLWFAAAVVMAIADRRGGELSWHTRDTGSLRLTPCRVHFGVNSLGLVNVMAKDIAYLPEWQQPLWGGFNVRPEGGVSEELLAAQAVGRPAVTQAPEAFLAKAIEVLNRIALVKLGHRMFREHEQFRTLLARAHRFRAVDQAGLLSLAKDVARLTADSIDAGALQKMVPPPKGETWGSLKSLECVVAKYCDVSTAHSVLGPLHGAYNLRHADAHLPGEDLAEAYQLLGIDRSLPFVLQGFELLDSCVGALFKIAKILR
jgi:hypothetical protein